MSKRVGSRTVALPAHPGVLAWASVAGQKEKDGPYGERFDQIIENELNGEQSFEAAERRMLETAVMLCAGKAGCATGDVQMLLAGDLLNQIISAGFAARNLEIPFYGLYGACSTMSESLSLGGMLADGGFADRLICATCSHFCTAERQYRMPVPYGSQRPPTAQWTATASGCTILTGEGNGPYITHVTCGKIVDRGVADANNMGAAMAPAAYDTLAAFFRDTATKPSDYDLVLTGDLGTLGHDIVREFFMRDGIDMGEGFQDCGLLLYDRQQQDMHAGASGCGCSAAVLNGYLLSRFRDGSLKRIVFAPTGALLSPTSSFQGESIPGICHAVCISCDK